METVLLSAGVLTKFIVTKPSGYASHYARSNDNGIVALTEPSVFSPLVKIEVERATRNPDKYVHLRFCHNNKYWGRAPDVGISIVSLLAEASEPEEDITKLSCTLFEAVRATNDTTNTLFNLIHVQSGGYVMGLTAMARLSLRMPIPSPVPIDPVSMNLTSVNWDELVKLPERIALIGHNDNYLGGRVRSRTNSLHLSFPDGRAKEAIQEVYLMNDGHVRIKSVHFDRFWRRDPSNNWGRILCWTKEPSTPCWAVLNSNKIVYV